MAEMKVGLQITKPSKCVIEELDSDAMRYHDYTHLKDTTLAAMMAAMMAALTVGLNLIKTYIC
jgi:hypothetical protein